MRFKLKQIALAGLLTCLGASAMAANYFYVQPKSMEMSKVSPLSVALNPSALPAGEVGRIYNGIGYNFAPLVAISGDPALNQALATFSVTAGTLPLGMALSASGVLTGTPTALSAGTSLQITANYKTATAAQTYTWVSNPPTDPNISKVVYLSNFDLMSATPQIGLNGWLSGGAALTTGGKFGAGVATSGGTSILQSSSGALFTGDFTVEGWAKFTGGAISGTVFSFGSNGELALQGNSIGLNIFTCKYGSCSNLTGDYTPSISLNTWFHYAVVRSSGIMALYVNGVSKASVTATHPVGTASNNVALGNRPGWLNQPMVGVFDEFRVTQGLARYTGNFAVPSEPFPTR